MADYARHMLDSTFCLIPRGDTPTTNRLFDAISAGCIPVIVSENIDLVLPFSTFLDWRQFSVRLPQDLVLSNPRSLLEMLHGLSAKHVQKLQQELLKVRRHLIYGAGSISGERFAPGKVAELAMASLFCPLMPVPPHWGDQIPSRPRPHPTTPTTHVTHQSPPTAPWTSAVHLCLMQCSAFPACKGVVWGTAGAPFPGCHLKPSGTVTPLRVPAGGAALYTAYVPSASKTTWTIHPAADIAAPSGAPLPFLWVGFLRLAPVGAPLPQGAGSLGLVWPAPLPPPPLRDPDGRVVSTLGAVARADAKCQPQWHL